MVEHKRIWSQKKKEKKKKNKRKKGKKKDASFPACGVER